MPHDHIHRIVDGEIQTSEIPSYEQVQSALGITRVAIAWIAVHSKDYEVRKLAMKTIGDAAIALMVKP